MRHLVTSNAKEKEKENAVMEPCKKYLAGHIRVLNSAAAVECGISTLAVLNNCVRCDLFVLATYDRFTFNLFAFYCVAFYHVALTPLLTTPLSYFPAFLIPAFVLILLCSKSLIALKPFG
jgi:hypothetical protein